MTIDAGGWAAIVTALGVAVSLAAALFAASQARSAKESLKLARESTAAAKDQAQIASDSLKEVTRARVDDHASRVILLMGAPEWPPLVDRTRSSMPGGGELGLLESLGRSAQADVQPFFFDEQRSWFLWFRTRGILRNEGSASARIRLDGDAQFVSGTSDLLGPDVTIDVPQRVGDADRREYLLRPGDSALFEWAYGHTLGDWADAYTNYSPPNPKGAGFFSATAFDLQSTGTIDQLYALLEARPILPVPGRIGQWRIAETADGIVGVNVFPPVRLYRSEGQTIPPPPWAEMFGSSDT